MGPGSKVLDEIDSTVLMFLYLKEPSRSLKSYVSELEFLTDTAYAFMAIVDGISHDEVLRFYAGSGLVGNE